MRQPEQIALLKRLLHFVETKTTCMAETPYRNPVTTYTDPARRDEGGQRRDAPQVDRGGDRDPGDRVVPGRGRGGRLRRRVERLIAMVAFNIDVELE